MVAIGIVIVVAVQRHGLGANLVGLHHQADGLGQLVQELIRGVGGTTLQFQYDVLLVPVNGGVEIAAGVDLIYQLADDGGAGAALIAGVGGQDGLAIWIECVQGHYVARFIIVHLNFRIYTQQHGSYGAVSGFLHHGGSAAGVIGRRSCPGVSPAGSQSGQGQSSGQGKPKQFGSEVLFHVNHLKILLLCLSSVDRLRSRGPKNGVF